MVKDVLPAIDAGKSFWNNEMQRKAAEQIRSTFEDFKFTKYTNLANFADRDRSNNQRIQSLKRGKPKDDAEYNDCDAD